MNENILSWNVENWVTIILMAAIGFYLLAIGQKFFQQTRGRTAVNQPTGSNTLQGAGVQANIQPTFAR